MNKYSKLLLLRKLLTQKLKNWRKILGRVMKRPRGTWKVAFLGVRLGQSVRRESHGGKGKEEN